MKKIMDMTIKELVELLQDEKLKPQENMNWFVEFSNSGVTLTKGEKALGWKTKDRIIIARGDEVIPTIFGVDLIEEAHLTIIQKDRKRRVLEKSEKLSETMLKTIKKLETKKYGGRYTTEKSLEKKGIIVPFNVHKDEEFRLAWMTDKNFEWWGKNYA